MPTANAKGEFSPSVYTANIVIVSLGFFGIFAAFNASQALQTSIAGNLGHVCLSALYISFTINSLFASKLVSMLNPKWAMVAGSVPYVAVVVCNLKPSYYLSVPLNVLLGLGAGVIWTAEGTYVSRNAAWYSRVTGVSYSNATSHFNSLFFAIYQFTGTAGTVLSSLVLLYGGSNAKNALFYVLSAVCAVGGLVLILVRNLPSAPETTELGLPDDKDAGHEADLAPTAAAAADGAEEPADAEADMSVWEPLFLLGRSKALRLLVLSIFYNGLSLGYFFGDFTASIVKPAVGVKYSGFVVAAFYFVNCIATIGWGKVANSPRFGRRFLVAVAFVLQTGHFLLFLLWPVPHVADGGSASIGTWVCLFAGAALFGAGDAVWESQQPAILQSFFNKDSDRNAAMGNLKMWQSLGFGVQFAVGLVLTSVTVKITYLLALLVLSTLLVVLCDRMVQPLDSKVQDSQPLLGEQERSNMA